MGEVFLFRKLAFLFWMPLIKANDVSLVVRFSQQLRKSSPCYRLERAATHQGLGDHSPGTARLGSEAVKAIQARRWVQKLNHPTPPNLGLLSKVKAGLAISSWKLDLILARSFLAPRAGTRCWCHPSQDPAPTPACPSQWHVRELDTYTAGWHWRATGTPSEQHVLEANQSQNNETNPRIAFPSVNCCVGALFCLWPRCHLRGSGLQA